MTRRQCHASTVRYLVGLQSFLEFIMSDNDHPSELDTTAFLNSLLQPDGARRMYVGAVRVERKVGEGKLSESYLGHHEGLDIPVLVRVMKPEIRDALGEATYRGLTVACQQYARVRHETITAIYDVGTHQTFPYTVIEYVTGVPLLERISDRPLTAAETLALFTPIAHGLSALWRQDFLHRGISPLRVLVTNTGTPKLDIVILPRIPLEKTLVAAHKPFMAGFWSPEELRGAANLDQRSDIFSFGASMFFALTGVSPYGAGDPDSRIQRTLNQAPLTITDVEPDTHPDMVRFITRCTAPDPAKRFDSAQEFVDELLTLEATISGKVHRSRGTFGPNMLAAPPGGPIAEGSQLGQAILEKKAGEGAFGVVYKARHRILDIPLAVKLLPMDLAEKNPEFVQLFLREARTAIRIRHKNVIGIYGAGEVQGQYFLAMEWAPGGSVAERLPLFPDGMPEAEVKKVILETALGLMAARDLDIVHRDIKPANLMYGSSGEIKIADLGLAKRINVQDGEKTQVISESMVKEMLTMRRGNNTVQGTPAYMAPEMITHPDKADYRSDLYSLGVTAFQMVTGKLPFTAPQPLQVLLMHCTQPPPNPKQFRADLSPNIEKLILGLLEKLPDKRIAEMEDISKLLN